jgi:peroxiredoxin
MNEQLAKMLANELIESDYNYDEITVEHQFPKETDKETQYDIIVTDLTFNTEQLNDLLKILAQHPSLDLTIEENKARFFSKEA